ncbi:hypothetical protein H4Q26_003053 [Puccinia striiformis f. sp. tritici PST-130]|nr:hypothetical protein H4Q26_003053 [Puccinia striiformis f. sp. tritici PST-130]
MSKRLTIRLSYDIVRVTLPTCLEALSTIMGFRPYPQSSLSGWRHEGEQEYSTFPRTQQTQEDGAIQFSILPPINEEIPLEVIFENQVSVSKDMSEVLKFLSPDPIEAKKLEECLTERVVEEGGFGFPWLEITQPDGQRLTIFGSDRFEFLANWLGKEWEGPNPSSSNPRESRL